MVVTPGSIFLILALICLDNPRTLINVKLIKLSRCFGKELIGLLPIYKLAKLIKLLNDSGKEVNLFRSKYKLFKLTKSPNDSDKNSNLLLLRFNQIKLVNP